jgi:hypothetical protein
VRGRRPPAQRRLRRARGRGAPRPVVRAGQVRIAVGAAGVNFADTMARVGLYPTRRRPRASWATRSPAGSRRPARAWTGRPSATASWPARASAATPRRSSPPPPTPWRCRRPLRRAGRGGAVNYATAYAALFEAAGLRSGERVLIHAAAGGVGIAAPPAGRLTEARRSGAPHRRASTTPSAASGSSTRWTTRAPAGTAGCRRSTSCWTRWVARRSGAATGCCARAAGSSPSARRAS